MKQLIVKRAYWYQQSCFRKGKGSVAVRLACGHEKVFKASQEPKRFCLCRDCDRGLPATKPEHSFFR